MRPINPPGKEKPEEGLIVVEGAPERDILRVPFTAVPVRASFPHCHNLQRPIGMLGLRKGTVVLLAEPRSADSPWFCSV